MKIREAAVNGTQGWVLDYGKRDGLRRRRYFKTEKEALNALKAARKEAVAIGRRWAELPPEQRADVVTILEEIEASGHTLRNVWESFRDSASAAVTERKSLGDAIDELVKAKTVAKRRPAYVTSLEQYLRRWAKGQEAKPIATVRLEDIERFILGLPSASSRATAINRLSTLFSFAVRREWRIDNPCKRLERPSIETATPAILTLDETMKVLAYTRCQMPRFLPWLVLALFAGVRPEEADKLAWDAIDVDRGLVTIGALIAKVRNRRIVHLKPVAVTWLKLGGDLPLPRVTRRRCIRKLRDVLGWSVWKKDVLRHTAASYWLASDPDTAKLALELGNSPAVLFKHYRELVGEEQAKAFWALTPKEVGRK